MYLSRLLLDPRSRQVQRETADPYQLHRTLMRAFPETLSQAERVLHRLEIDLRSGRMMLLVQSQTNPNWGWLVEKGYLAPSDPFSDLVNPAVKEVTLSFQPGQRLRFRLRANPTKRVLYDDPARKLKKGQRIGLLKEADQIAWLVRKGEKGGGFALLETTITHEGFSGGRTKTKQPLKHLAVRFEGLLQVKDPAQFLASIHSGIGSGKGLGFGLLSVAKA